MRLDNTIHLWLLRISEPRTLADLGYSLLPAIKDIYPLCVEPWYPVLPHASNRVLVIKLVCYTYVHHKCALSVLHDVIECVSLRVPHSHTWNSSLVHQVDLH